MSCLHSMLFLRDLQYPQSISEYLEKSFELQIRLYCHESGPALTFLVRFQNTCSPLRSRKCACYQSHTHYLVFHFKISFGYKNVFRFINERPYSLRQIVRLSTTYISVLSLRMHILTMFGTLKYQWRGAPPLVLYIKIFKYQQKSMVYSFRRFFITMRCHPNSGLA